MGIWQNLFGTTETAFRIGKAKAVIDASGLSTSRTQTLPNKAGTFAMLSDVPKVIPVACSDETTALTTGLKVTFRMPFAMTLSALKGSLTTAQTSGSIFRVDVKKGGTSIFSTLLTIDNTEKTSATAATAAVISDASLADDDEITILIDQVGDGTAKGLKIYLVGT